MLKADGYFEEKNDRGNEPATWQKTAIAALNQVGGAAGFQTFNVDKFGVAVHYSMTWHHNVSFEQLKFLWNYLRNAAEAGAGGVDLFRSYINSCFGIDLGTAGAVVSDFLAPDGGRPASTVRDDLFDRVTWMGWNIVEGPPSDVRSDDPKVRFDDFDVPGLPATHGTRVKLARALDSAINNVARRLQLDKALPSGKITIAWQDDASQHGTAVYNGLNAALGSAITAIAAVNTEAPLAFIPAMWTFVPARKRFKKQTPV